jgi:hypothetical protein
MLANGVLKATGLCLVLCAIASFARAADDPLMGTWKLNEAKSKFAPGAPKNDTVVYEMAGDKVKVTVDGKDGEGKSLHNTWTGKFDGKDYAVEGDSSSDMRSYKKTNDRTLSMTVKKDGKVTSTGSVAVSADGKSRTVTTHGTDAKGKKSKNTAVYDKQ